MTIFSVNPTDRGKPHEKMKGPFQGQHSRMHNGKMYRSPKFKGRTRKEVEMAGERWLVDGGFEKLIARKTAASIVVPVIQLTGDYLDKWFVEASGTWAGTTLQTNTSTFNVWLRDDGLRDCPFPPTLDDVKAFYGRIDASANTKYRVHKLLFSAFEVAIDERKIHLNPCKYKQSPKKPKRNSSVEAFTSKDERQLLNFAKDDPTWNPLLLFAFDSGVRQQELFGVQVRHIDFERGEVSIETTVDTIGGRAVPKQLTKTDASRRTIALSLATLAALKRLVGQKSGRSDYVFVQATGELWTRTRFHTSWTSFLISAEVRHYGFHATRHTMATRLLRAGCFLTAVSRRLGHSKPSITLDIYSHALPSDQAPLAAAFDAFFAEIAPAIAPSEEPGLKLAS